MQKTTLTLSLRERSIEKSLEITSRIILSGASELNLDITEKTLRVKNSDDLNSDCLLALKSEQILESPTSMSSSSESSTSMILTAPAFTQIFIQSLLQSVVNQLPEIKIALSSSKKGAYSVIVLALNVDLMPESLTQQLEWLCGSHQVDSFIQPDISKKWQPKLAVFDMDSTLIQHEVIDELAVAAGVEEQVVGITEQAMRGEIDFSESLQLRVSLLKGLPETALERVAIRLNLSAGAEPLFQYLNQINCHSAILSGGFDYFGNYLSKKLGIHQVYANQLEIINGKLTGNVLGVIVDAQRKSDLLQKIAKEQGVDLKDTLAVGDGANDLIMLATAKLGVAFHAKPIVQSTAKHSIRFHGLDTLLAII